MCESRSAQWYAGKCLTTDSLTKRKKAPIVVFANFCGINTHRGQFQATKVMSLKHVGKDVHHGLSLILLLCCWVRQPWFKGKVSSESFLSLQASKSSWVSLEKQLPATQCCCVVKGFPQNHPKGLELVLRAPPRGCCSSAFPVGHRSAV